MERKAILPDCVQRTGRVGLARSTDGDAIGWRRERLERRRSQVGAEAKDNSCPPVSPRRGLHTLLRAAHAGAGMGGTFACVLLLHSPV
jgi:hypothetical protein